LRGGNKNRSDGVRKSGGVGCFTDRRENLQLELEKVNLSATSLLRDPMRMVGKNSVHVAHFIDDENTEGDAEDSRGDG
jgi:hypothetical protein